MLLRVRVVLETSLTYSSVFFLSFTAQKEEVNMLREHYRLVNLMERLMVSTGHTSYDVSMLLFITIHTYNKP